MSYSPKVRGFYSDNYVVLRIWNGDDEMDNILFCRPASEFTIEELEAKIGPLKGKYEKIFFDVLKEKIRKNPIDYLNYFRINIMDSSNPERGEWLLYQEFDESDEDFFPADGVSNLDLFYLLRGWEHAQKHPNRAQMILSELEGFTRRLITTIVSLGYVRCNLISFGRFLEERLAWLVKWHDFSWVEMRNNSSIYETYRFDCNGKLKEALGFLENKLPPVQFSLFQYNVLSGALMGDYDESDHSPYSDTEWGILRTAVKNARQYQDELRKIIFS